MLWKKAGDDLLAARAILSSEVALDMVGFHARQAVEKSLKAILAIEDVIYPKTHDIRELIDLAKPRMPDWPFVDQALTSLNRFAIDVRYDARHSEADLAEAGVALGTAERVHHHVGKMIGPDPRSPDDSAGV